ncbi:DMT family transporter [Candidatus Leptofilum sp.]|uniref:DMT family transporter n=1 Tax=Candidatus Leptofilum sp. TaxID=3241576 RepID=UPI003B59C08C
MDKSQIFALVVGLGSGLAIGIQGTLNNWAGKLVGPIGNGLLVNAVGGLIAVLLILITGMRYINNYQTISSAAPYIIFSGILGIGIISGISFSLPRIGIAAGLAVLIFGQMLIGIFVDTLGLNGGQAIPLSLYRIAGLFLLFLSVWFLIPRN